MNALPPGKFYDILAPHLVVHRCLDDSDHYAPVLGVVPGVPVLAPVDQARFRESHEFLRRSLIDARIRDGLSTNNLSICQVLQKLPQDTSLFLDRQNGNAVRCADHFCLTPNFNQWSFDDLNEWAKGNSPIEIKERTEHWQVCMLCSSDVVEVQEPDLPDDGYLIHAAKSLRMMAEDCDRALNLRFEARLYQHSLDVGDKMCWNDLLGWNDERILQILKLSLPLYQRTVRAKYNYEIESMLADVDRWLISLSDTTVSVSVQSGVMDEIGAKVEKSLVS